MDPKKILDFTELVDDVQILNLNNEDIKKLIDDETNNIYNIFSSIYHSKLVKSGVIDDTHFSDGTKFIEQKSCKPCLYCARDHDHTECPYVICKKCGDRGHIIKKCINNFTPKKSTLCKKCTFTSHSEFDCPAAYRKYIILGDIPELIKNCGNCAGEHFTNDCPSSRESSKFCVFNEKYINYLRKK